MPNEKQLQTISPGDLNVKSGFVLTFHEFKSDAPEIWLKAKSYLTFARTRSRVVLVKGMNVLVVDIGGTHIKFRTQRRQEPVRIKSGPKMTPVKMLAAIGTLTKGWKYDRVSLGYPGLVIHDSPVTEPHNLGEGWVDFDYRQAFGGKEIRMVNDAAMQALGGYRGGRMLFLGLGTGLGSAMVVDGVVQDIALAHLIWKKRRTYEDFLGAAALKKKGRKAWRANVSELLETLEKTLKSDYVVLGGGNAKLATDLPEHVSLGSNENAFKGGFLLWTDRASSA